MKNNLQIFKNEIFGEIRVIEMEGKPYTVANDVLKALGYKEGSWRTTLSRKCKGVTKCNGLKTNGVEINLIPEGDIYRLIASSKLPEAEKFESWVFDEVLPQIRQTGGYININENDSEAEIMAKALMIAQKTIDNKDKLIETMKPKVQQYDYFIEKEATWGFRELRKEIESALEISIKETRLKEVMRDKGWIGRTTKALSYAIREGYAVTKDIMDNNDNPRTQDRFTEKSRLELLEYFRK